MNRATYRVDMLHDGVWWDCESFPTEQEAFAAVHTRRKDGIGTQYRIIEILEREIECWLRPTGVTHFDEKGNVEK